MLTYKGIYICMYVCVSACNISLYLEVVPLLYMLFIPDHRCGDMRVVMNDLMVNYWKQLGRSPCLLYSTCPGICCMCCV